MTPAHCYSTAVLEELHASCCEFDATCRSAVAHAQLGQHELLELQEHLWDLNRQICRCIESHPDPVLLGEFRAGEFAGRVLKWYRLNPHFDRLWTKPAGYSGDHWIIELLCRSHSTWRSVPDVFLNHMTESPMAQQHRSKVMHQASFLVRVMSQQLGRPLSILNVGCGPCFDVRLALDELGEPVDADITLVDLDPAALAFSRRKLEGRPVVRTRFVQSDVVKLIRRLSTDATQHFDAILFGGLFDYVPDSIIAFILRNSRRLLRPGGQLLFSQVSTDNPTRTAMDWFCDWRLLERDEDHLIDLATRAGVPRDELTLWRDQTQTAILCQVGT